MQFLVSASGTTITGEEEQYKKFYNRKKEGDTIVTILFVHLILIEQLRGINKLRIGEEQEVSNLIEYLTNASVREWLHCNSAIIIYFI